ncbi:T9SS type A sorting domain-containing protein [Reichenbachiella sp.]|uniref:T9SS type A sorting domain-containing protein n=1 Tax=Reichenbachiella sp. TaxID=2184521 RepID=UPI003BAE3BEE
MTQFKCLGSLLRITIPFLLLFCIISPIRATHIRAGEIVVERASSSGYTYKITVIGYSDTGSSVVFGGGEIDFGDGSTLILAENADEDGITIIEDEVAYNYYEIQHTYSTFGRYTISYSERNRNAGVLNMSNSVDTPFYVETTVLLDPFVGLNSTPIFLVPPVDKGAVGVSFLHYPGAYDSDGDSLSFRLSTPRQGLNEFVSNYLSPVDPDFYSNYQKGNEAKNGTPSFEIDYETGKLTWNAPGSPGEYSVAFVVDEWRKVEGKWIRMGSITRDMQIIIEETSDKKPEIEKLSDLCVGAGETVSTTISASDPDGHEVKIEGFGAPFEFESDAAVLTNEGEFEPTPSHQNFEWNTTCEQVRADPYVIFVKATDNPELGPKLVDFEFFEIHLTVPSPSGLVVGEYAAGEVSLSWDSYNECSTTGVNVWRKLGGGIPVTNDCEVQDLEQLGYTNITSSTDKTTYNDQNLIAGAMHCYSLQAGVLDEIEGVSKPSEDVCFTMPAISAVPIKVDVTKTAETNGTVELEWLSPFDLVDASTLEPFTYEVFRGSSESDLNKIATTDELNYIDSDVNTTSKLYYRIDTYDKSNKLVEKSAVASTIDLSVRNAGLSVQLEWKVDAPWSVFDTDHIIYRDHVDSADPGKFKEIGRVDPTKGMRYSDEDTKLKPGIDYTYYIQVDGDYHNPDITHAINNRSQQMVSQVVIQSTEIHNEKILVFPNPFSHVLNIRNLGVKERFSLISSDGKVLLNDIGSTRLDGSHLNAGIYYLRLSSGKTIRLVKK